MDLPSRRCRSHAGSHVSLAHAPSMYGTWTQAGTSSNGWLTLLCGLMAIVVGVLLLKGFVSRAWPFGAGGAGVHDRAAR